MPDQARLHRIQAAKLLAPALLLLSLVACGGQNPVAESAAAAAPAEAAAEGQAKHAIVRIPVESNAPDGLPAAISAGKADGTITHAVWLDSTQEEKAGFSSIAVLEFKDAAGLASWHGANASLLAPPVELRPADLLYRVENPGRDSSIAVFQGNYMDPKVSREEFTSFADRYMRKYLELQREADILTSYAMYLEHPAPAGGGLAFMLREHKDQETFDDRNSTKDRLRDDLMARDADYKSLEDTAIEYRAHVSSTRARDVPLP